MAEPHHSGGVWSAIAADKLGYSRADRAAMLERKNGGDAG